MATQEQLILSQLAAEEAQIYKPKDDTGSGLVQDLTAGVLGYQAAEEAFYGLEGAARDYNAKKQEQYKAEARGLLSRVKDTEDELTDNELMIPELMGPDQPVTNISMIEMDEIANDFINSTSNVEMSNDGTMTKTKYKTFGPLNYQNDAYVNPYKLLNKKLSSNVNYIDSLSPNNQGMYETTVQGYRENALGERDYIQSTGASRDFGFARTQAQNNMSTGNYTSIPESQYKGNK